MDAKRLAKFIAGKSDTQGGYNINQVVPILMKEGLLTDKQAKMIPRALLIHIANGGKFPETRQDLDRWSPHLVGLHMPAPVAPAPVAAPDPVAPAPAVVAPVPLEGAALGAFLDDVGAQDVNYIDEDEVQPKPLPYNRDSDDEDIIPPNFFEEPVIDAGYVAHEHAKKAARTHAKRRKLTEGEKLAFKRGQRSGVWLANHSEA